MGNWHQVARARDFGVGVAGRALGPPCNVYRPLGSVSGDFIQAANLVGQTNVFRRLSVSKADQESPAHSFGTLFYEILVDATFWFVGDVFVEHDPFYGAGDTYVEYATGQFPGYCLCAHSPIKPIMAARVDRPASIYRPVTAADSRSVFSPTIGSNMAPIVNVGGTWAPGTVGATPAKIPVGMMAMPRDRDAVFKPAPGDTGSSAWFCYIPPLSGFNPREGDRILVDTGRFVVKHPYQQQVGAVGSQLLLSREIGNS